MKREYRARPELEIRQSPGNELRIAGYAAVFNQLSEKIMFFRERIKPGAFTKSLSKDIRAFNGHVSSQPLGRTKNGTLIVREDDHGLYVEIVPPNNSVGHDVVESIRRGDIDQMSFGFSVEKDNQKWLTENGEDIRELIEVDLFEVSPVAMPAYTQTSAALSVRSLWPDGMPEDIENLQKRPILIIAEETPPQPSPSRKLLDELANKYGLKKPA